MSDARLFMVELLICRLYVSFYLETIFAPKCPDASVFDSKSVLLGILMLLNVWTFD